MQGLTLLFEEDILVAIAPETCVKNRNSYGGTSYGQVDMQLKLAKEIMAAEGAAVSANAAKQAKVNE